MHEKRIQLLALGLVLVLGVAVRAVDLGTHFTHIDDMNVILHTFDALDPSRPFVSWLRGVHVIASMTTYAPLQFLLTTALITPDMDFETVLWRGRFPSLLAGIAGLILLLILVRNLRKERVFPAQLLALTLLACSWENIIYAKQTSSYAIGVTAAIAVLLLLLHLLRTPSWSLGTMLGTGLLLGLLSAAQYQAIFFLPAFFAVLFLHQRAKGARNVSVIKDLAAAGAVAAIFVLPLYYYFIRTVPLKAAYISWNGGPAGEFAFSLEGQGGAFGGILYAVKFFGGNLFTAFQAMTAVVPEAHPLAAVLGGLLLVLFLLGMASFADTRDRERRSIGIFILLTALTWAALIMARKLSFGPTRHALVLLPFFALGVAEGIFYGAGKIRNERWKDRLPAIICYGTTATLLALHLVTLPSMLAERRNKFDEREIAGILRQYEAGVVLQHDWTMQLSLMPSVRGSVPLGANFTAQPPRVQRQLIEQLANRTIVFVSHRSPLPDSVADLLREQGLVRDYSKELSSRVEVDYSSRTSNGANCLFLDVYRKGARPVS